MEIKHKKKILPYYSSADVKVNVINSSKHRKQNVLVFTFIKLKNYFLGLIAYICPINNIRIICHKLRGVSIGKNVFIGMRCTLDHAYPKYIYIDDNAILSGNVYLICHNKPSIHFRRKVMSYVAPIYVKKNSFLGVGTFILPGTTIGSGSITAAGSVVFEDVPENSIVRGNPAEVIQNL